MKKLFRKNQMIITTLAIIIAVAGYVNYSGKYTSSSKTKTKTVSNTAEKVSGEVTDDITDVGEAVLTNAQVSNYVAKAKLEREQTHSKAQDSLEEIVNDKSVKDSVKQDAVDKLSSLAEQREMETAAENLLGAKGFLNSIVTISNGNVDVLVNKKDLSKVERSQIEDIIVRKTGFKVDQIVITSIKTED
nr:SpoIIIAH-like family protein [uncultured Anaerostipes sp.]